MAKRKSEKKEKSKVEQQQKKKAEDVSTEESKPFDFGGIPDRDLKKNLGCG